MSGMAMFADQAPAYAVATLLGYLLGSIPFGVVLAYLSGLGDLRQIGSGNIGATNVLRTGRKGLAGLTLLLDAAKGAVAVLLAAAFGPLHQLAAGAAAFLGHVFPVWLSFKGGKGVATYLGALVALSWPVGIAFAAVWLATAVLSRVSSLSALTASLVTPPALFLAGERPEALAFVALTAILWLRHADNIRRLIGGVEPRIGGPR
jgi:glycerol-3-phosphate acyltransferase PlsY